MWVLRKRDPERPALVIEYGADVNAKSKQGWPAPMLAAEARRF
jgi:hypothetical protein